MKNLTCLSLLLIVSLTINAQKLITYDDVLVVANTLSPESMEIARYFQTERDIPDENIIEIEIFPSETINDFELEDMMAQIENQILSHPNLPSLNYIVTTKGVPLKVNDYCGSKDIANCKSIDEELITIITSPETNLGGAQGGAIQNPYFDQDVPFSRSEFDIFLVTRLDGFDVQDVKRLIDRSGNLMPISKESSKLVFDVVTSDQSGLEPYLYSAISKAVENLNDQEWNVAGDTDQGVFKDQTDVLGLVMLSSEKSFKSAKHEMLPGSIGELGFCYSGASFDEEQTSDVNAAGFYIRSGITGLSAYTHITYFSPMTQTSILFDRYLSEDTNYNLAESFFGSKNIVKLHHVVIGDPKSSVSNVRTTSAEDIANSSVAIDIFPNPSSGRLSVKVPEDFNGKLTIYDNLAQVISVIPVNRDQLNIDLSKYPKGIYNFSFSSKTILQTQRVVIQ